MTKRPNSSETCVSKEKIIRLGEECKFSLESKTLTKYLQFKSKGNKFISICTECFAPLNGTAEELTLTLKSHHCNADESIDRIENFQEFQRLIKAIEPTKPAPPPPPMPLPLFITGTSNQGKFRHIRMHITLELKRILQKAQNQVVQVPRRLVKKFQRQKNPLE